jgi:FtsZ-binding cell division protein ZapB
MTAKNVNTFLANMQKKAKKYSDVGKDVLFSATFINGSSQRTPIANQLAKSIPKQVKSLLIIEKPEKIKIDLFTREGEYLDMNVCEIVNEAVVLTAVPVQEHKGLGEVEINQIVDQRIAEKQRAIEFEQLKEEVKELTSENEDLQNEIDALEERNTELETELANKQEIRYYTGMLGDILEGFGFSKDKMRKPIAGLLGFTEEKSAGRKELPATTTDNSGIVEEPSSPAVTPPVAIPAETTAPVSDQGMYSPEEQKKRNELIDLIAAYLHSSSTQVIAKVFAIFSEIETDNAVADDLIEQLIKRKESSHDNV